jgi:hypothetical protein
VPSRPARGNHSTTRPQRTTDTEVRYSVPVWKLKTTDNASTPLRDGQELIIFTSEIMR